MAGLMTSIDGSRAMPRLNPELVGVTRGETLTGDLYEGTKHALISAGICRLEWFPAAPVPYRGGLFKRRFTIEDDGRTVLLVDDNARSTWLVSIPWSEEECRKREAERDRQEALTKQHEQKSREADFKAKLTRRLATLPVFVPDSMSDGEMYVMRLLRALDDPGLDFIVGLAERQLARQNADEELRPRHLRLVVDNEKDEKH
jgi:hypothetical protein